MNICVVLQEREYIHWHEDESGLKKLILRQLNREITVFKKESVTSLETSSWQVQNEPTA